jgi:hypothetical protein
MAGIVTLKQCLLVPKSKKEEKYIDKSFKKYTKLFLSLPRGQGWTHESLYEFNGFWFPPHSGLEGLLWMQDHFNPKPTDIFVSTYPKTGTTWLKALIFSIMKRTEVDFSNHPLLKHNPHQLVPYLELGLFRCPPLGDPEILPSPRILASHLPYTLLPKSISDSSSKMVYISRDPKDVFVSTWLFMDRIRRNRHGLPPFPIEEAFDLFCNGVSPTGPYWDHVLGYWKASLEHPENVLFLKYEAVEDDAAGHVTKLAEFLGFPFTGEEKENGVVQEIVKMCSFASLSNLENTIFFRKGMVGDSKNYLTPEMTEVIDKVTEEKLNGTGFTFQV